MFELIEAIDVFYVPDWMVKVRQVGRLLMGVSAQSARPVSLAKEWEPIAKRVLRDQMGENRRHRLRNKSAHADDR